MRLRRTTGTRNLVRATFDVKRSRSGFPRLRRVALMVSGEGIDRGELEREIGELVKGLVDSVEVVSTERARSALDTLGVDAYAPEHRRSFLAELEADALLEVAATPQEGEEGELEVSVALVTTEGELLVDGRGKGWPAASEVTRDAVAAILARRIVKQAFRGRHR